eukprot:CAMPEP_0194342762 /NCGR_PEP_ID=MMETSP0171-20130528/94015_1 /TAXON_ID=218684 /ORGANISM="Corethron pennatum, Strain L29A3" /LENGTH=91 /DNA_ID=CAMNT_0039108663 /DNA_START=331 /DNA_END=603 /DNA_ORIENTATION=-
MNLEQHENTLTSRVFDGGAAADNFLLAEPVLPCNCRGGKNTTGTPEENHIEKRNFCRKGSAHNSRIGGTRRNLRDAGPDGHPDGVPRSLRE